MSSRQALVFPVLPGKDARDIANELKSRPREYEESRKRLGITMERAYLQHTPMGDFVTAYIEAEGDVLEKFGKLASSDLDIDRYFVKASKEIHGAYVSQPLPGPAPETVAAWVDPAARGRGRGMGGGAGWPAYSSMVMKPKSMCSCMWQWKRVRPGMLAVKSTSAS